MNIDRARQLRHEMTEAEQFLWKRLRHRQLLGMKFRRQVPIGSFIADFCCLERRVIVELDGGQHVDEEAYDVGRTEWLQSQGFRVLRFWNHEVFKETQVVLDAIVEALEEALPLAKSACRKERSRLVTSPRPAEPPPLPSPARGEGDRSRGEGVDEELADGAENTGAGVNRAEGPVRSKAKRARSTAEGARSVADTAQRAAEGGKGAGRTEKLPPPRRGRVVLPSPLQGRKKLPPPSRGRVGVGGSSRLGSSSRRRDTRSQHRSGFTLVELLISIVIIGILAALGAAAYIRSMAGAKVKSTQALIENLNSALQERLEIFRAVKISNPPVNILALARRSATDPINPGSPAYRRAEVILRLSLARDLFTQQFWDIVPYTPDTSANDNPIGTPPDPAAGGALLRDFQKNFRLIAAAPPSLDLTNTTTWGVHFFPAKTKTADLLHDHDTGSSECLHMILNWAPEGTSITSASIPAQFKADTDGDGLMEFVDAWGRPLKFYRAPTDLYAYLIDVAREMQDPGISANSIDPNGLLVDPSWFNAPGTSPYATKAREFEALGLARLHDAYQPPSAPGGPRDPASTPQPTVPRAYPTNPLIVSAGPDGKFGFWTPYSASENPPTRRDPHPVTDGGAGTGKFLHFRCARVDPLEVEFVADNITNLNVTGSRGN